MAHVVTIPSIDWGEHALLPKILASLPSGTGLLVVSYQSLLLSILCWFHLICHYLKVGVP